ncbi:hypothetical protein KC960_00920 [Candidatus Saccharibacteria bacterium]|nr:hypothetical protein [Candidatus Saccharibacteria bacterium]
MSSAPTTPNQEFPNFDQANSYVETVRELYRNGAGEYRGRRNEDQQLIAEVTSDEARLLVDGVMLGLLALSGTDDKKTTANLDSDEQIIGSHSWKSFRGEFERLLVGFGVLTNRLHRDGFGVPSYADLGEADRIKAASVMLTDFLAHNALRFGVDTSGVHKTDFKTIHTDDGGIKHERITYDKDKAKTRHELDKNIRKRGFSSSPATHQAGKISPKEYVKLRREHPEMDADDFNQAVSFYTDVRKELENRE